MVELTSDLETTISLSSVIWEELPPPGSLWPAQVSRQTSPPQAASQPCGDGTTSKRCSSWRQTAPDDETDEQHCSNGFGSADILYGTQKDALPTRRFTQLCPEVHSLGRKPLLMASNHS